MNLIDVQPYYKVQREVSSIDQKNIELERHLYLYPDKVVTEHREFSINEIMDMSYRQFGKTGGLLYLHTLRGVFSYNVKVSPQTFIDSYKEYIGKW